ncbi:MAG TPA: Rpp14/Pop5 family protein, partial [Candidatus Thermoplasmatota archaeon]|nr:Rpp14/Pop5 family protein [Candidatus Thermoplasmatota archaeon]
AAFDGRLGLLKVKHWSALRTRELLATVTRIGKEPVAVRTLGTSGTARAARRKWLAGLVEG